MAKQSTAPVALPKTRVEIIDAMKTIARQQPTLTLVEAVTILGGGQFSEEARASRAVMLDVIEEREGGDFLDDLMDAIGM